MIKSYYNFFDKKIKHGTSVIFIISVFIFFVWLLFSSKNELLYSRNSVLQSNNITQENVIIISWVKYKIILEKLD